MTVLGRIERRLLALGGQQALQNPGFLYFEPESDGGDPVRETERHYAVSTSTTLDSNTSSAFNTKIVDYDSSGEADDSTDRAAR